MGLTCFRIYRPLQYSNLSVFKTICPCPIFGHVVEEPQPPPTPSHTPIAKQFSAEFVDIPEEEILPPWEDLEPLRHRVAFSIQSGEVAINPMRIEAAITHDVEQNVQFLDENVGPTAGFKYVDGINHSDTTTNTELKDFLSRPVRIAQFQWNESDLPGNLLSLSPWASFFTNTYVKQKTSNFAFVRCNLKVKVIINASPFYYGAILCNYLPVPTITPSTAIGTYIVDVGIPLSQRPHFWIYPANSEGGEMNLPFFWNKNWLNIQKAQDFFDMGTLRFDSYTFLQSANGVSSAGVTVQVYAWAEDVELSGPSVGLTMQTDEYGDGVMSKPASAIAAMAGKLSRDPTIGKFATATQIGASAFARMASMFGFSNPPVIENTQIFRPVAFPQMSNVETCYPSEKLTLDPKNELTVDPAVVGLESIDHCQISNLVQRESYLTAIAWTTANQPDDILFTSDVSPEMYAYNSGVQMAFLQGTPTWWLSRCFNAWRGDIIFRFKFVSTQYHKGRVRISWDPAGTATSNVYNTADTANVVETAVIDLGKDTDIEFRVPYHQAYPWLLLQKDPTPSNQPWSIQPTRVWTDRTDFCNGYLTVRVQTVLTAPIATSNVVMMVFVRGAENLEFANPGFDSKKAISFFSVQSGETLDSSIKGENPETVVAGTTNSVPKERYLVNFGESVTTLRSILYRHHLISVTQACHEGGYDSSVALQNFFRFPSSYGYDPNGIDTAKGLASTSSSFPFNYSIPNPIDWILSAFAGVRGSMVLTLNPCSAAVINHVRVRRNPEGILNTASRTFNGDNFLTNNSTASFASRFLSNGSGGSALTTTRTNQGLTTVLPHMSISKFTTTAPQYRNKALAQVHSERDGFTAEAYMSSANSSGQTADLKLEWYWAGGPDLTPLFFVNVPTTYWYNGTPMP